MSARKSDNGHGREYLIMDENLRNEIDDLVADREKFNKFVYTPIDEAVKEVKKRASNEDLKKYLQDRIPSGLPDTFGTNKYAILFRQVATPNYEVRRFISLIDVLDGYKPLIFEYFKDKFTDNNEFKYYLGMLAFFFGRGKKGGERIRFLNTIDFNSSRGKKIEEVQTIWGETLINFHHRLFEKAYMEKNKDILLFDASEWFAKNGSGASNYYKNFLSLFLQNNLLFENFMLDVKEITFTKEIFLPAFIQIFKETGYKPLIVALEPTEVESEVFWMCHPAETLPTVEEKLNFAKSPI